MKERKPLSDVGQIIQPYVKENVETDENCIDESANSSCVYSPMSVDHDQSMQKTCQSLTAYRLRCDIDAYTSELYSYLLDVEVIKNISSFGLLLKIIFGFRNYTALRLGT